MGDEVLFDDPHLQDFWEGLDKRAQREVRRSVTFGRLPSRSESAPVAQELARMRGGRAGLRLVLFQWGLLALGLLSSLLLRNSLGLWLLIPYAVWCTAWTVVYFNATRLIGRLALGTPPRAGAVPAAVPDAESVSRLPLRQAKLDKMLKRLPPARREAVTKAARKGLPLEEPWEAALAASSLSQKRRGAVGLFIMSIAFAAVIAVGGLAGATTDFDPYGYILLAWFGIATPVWEVVEYRSATRREMKYAQLAEAGLGIRYEQVRLRKFIWMGIGLTAGLGAFLTGAVALFRWSDHGSAVRDVIAWTSFGIAAWGATTLGWVLHSRSLEEQPSLGKIAVRSALIVAGAAAFCLILALVLVQFRPPSGN